MILGAVLVGGRSSRFGSDKAQAMFGTERLRDHAAALLASICDSVVLVGGGAIPDLPEPHLGPLGGVAAALDHAASHGFASVLTIGCDMPRLPASLLHALIRRAPAYCVEAPVLGHWPAALGAQLLGHLTTEPDRSVCRWARTIGAVPIAAGEPIANINTPEDLLVL
jgi:molybdopterin-guanine dinucleotide biosynthesis protein A